MILHLCDRCREPVDLNVAIGDDAAVYASVATGRPEDGRWREYHRRCARGLTLDEVWKTPGTVPL